MLLQIFGIEKPCCCIS